MIPSNHFAMTRFLNRLLRRSQLSEQEQQAILGLTSDAAQIQARRDVIAAGQQVDRACLLSEGLLGRFDQRADGRRQTSLFHLPGDMCDLHSVVAPLAIAGVEALTTSTVLFIPHSELQDLAACYPRIALAFWRDTAADASILAKRVSCLGVMDARSRVSHLLCEMAVRTEATGIGSRTDFPLPVTQNQLGEALGLTPVHINRTLMALRRDGVVEVQARRVEVLDWPAMVAIAEFDPQYLMIADTPATLVPETPQPLRQTQ